MMLRFSLADMQWTSRCWSSARHLDNGYGPFLAEVTFRMSASDRSGEAALVRTSLTLAHLQSSYTVTTVLRANSFFD